MRVALFVAGAAALAAPAFAATSVAAAQQNPFAIAAGPVKSARITYQVANDGKPAPTTSEMLISGEQAVIRMTGVQAVGGKRDSVYIYMRMTRDSVFRWTGMGKARSPGEAAASLRSHLATGYAALDAAGRQRVLDNLRRLAQAKGEGFDEVAPTIGVPAGKGSYAGQSCDRYRFERAEFCVLQGSNTILLYWSEGRMTYTATSVKLNSALSAADLAPPAGVRFRPTREPEADEIFGQIYGLENPDAEEMPTLADVGRTVIRFLARPDAVQRFQEAMGGDE